MLLLLLQKLVQRYNKPFIAIVPINIQNFIHEKGMLLSFEIMILSSKLLMRFGTGKVVFLYGTSSAGKSSICKEFKKIAPWWKIEGIDLNAGKKRLEVSKEGQLIKSSFFEKYQAILQYISEEEFLKMYLTYQFQCLNNHEEEIQKLIRKKVYEISEEFFLKYSHLFHETQLDLFEKILENSCNGIPTIVDTVLIDDFINFKMVNNFYCPIQFVLAYCSPKMLIEHMETRNKKAMATGNYNEARFGTDRLLQYGHFFKQKSKKNEPCLIKLEKDSIMQSLKHIWKQEMIHFGLNFTEQEKEKKADEFLIAFLKNLQVTYTAANDLELTPKTYRDYEIDTEKLNSQEAAAFIWNRNQ